MEVEVEGRHEGNAKGESECEREGRSKSMGECVGRSKGKAKGECECEREGTAKSMGERVGKSKGNGECEREPWGTGESDSERVTRSWSEGKGVPERKGGAEGGGAGKGRITPSCSPRAGMVDSGAGGSRPWGPGMAYPALPRIAWVTSWGHTRTTSSTKLFDLKATKLVRCQIFILKHDEGILVAYLLCFSKLSQLTLLQL